MPHCIARIFEPALCRWLPATGRHRAGPHTSPVVRADVPTQSYVPRAARVRPYVLVHERRQYEAQQPARRRALWLAVHGVDVGPRLIHGVEVA